MARFQDVINSVNELLEDPEAELSEDGIEAFCSNMADMLRANFSGKSKDRQNMLRASNLGLPPRRLWYAVKNKNPEQISAAMKMTFLYGNIIENLLLLLIREAGHTVTEEQKRVTLDGVTGTKDARIDGVTVDVKSASSFSFKKFESGDFLVGDGSNDPFGYKYQLGFYMAAADDDKGAFLVVNKENGKIVGVMLDREHDIPDVRLKIEEAKTVISKDTPPEEKCYPEEARGKSGNMIVNRLCSFCDFKDICWKDANDGKGLISHTYADGKVYFTKIVKDPKGSNKSDAEEQPTDDAV